MKKFLILTGSTGSGHIAASNALSAWILEQGHECKVEDICKFSRGGKTMRVMHKIISEYFGRFASLIFYATNNRFCKWLRKRFRLFSNSHKFENIIENYKPDYIIFTQKSRIPILTSYIHKSGKSFNISAVITHFGYSIHTLWIMDPEWCDNYFVFDPASKNHLIEKYDIPAKKIIVSFLPMPLDVFCKRETVSRYKLLLVCTGINTSFVKTFLDEFKEKKEYEISVSGARNENIAKLIPSYKSSKHIRFYKYFKNMGSSLRNFDIFIGKPGGAILAECIASETPIISPSHFYGEEDANVDIIRDYEIGFYLKEPEEVIQAIEYYNFNTMLPNFEKLKKDSCAIILNTILEGKFVVPKREKKQGLEQWINAQWEKLKS